MDRQRRPLAVPHRREDRGPPAEVGVEAHPRGVGHLHGHAPALHVGPAGAARQRPRAGEALPRALARPGHPRRVGEPRHPTARQSPRMKSSRSTQIPNSTAAAITALRPRAASCARVEAGSHSRSAFSSPKRAATS